MAGEDSAKIELGTGDQPPVDTSGGATGGGGDIDITTRFQVNKLTADHPGEAKFTEPPLKDVWGVTSSQERFWNAAQDTGLLIALKGTGEPTGIRVKLDQGITGIAVNDSDRLQMDLSGKCGQIEMLVASQTGKLWAVSSDISKTQGVVVLDRSKLGAQYTGVALIPRTRAQSNDGGNDGSVQTGRQVVLLVNFHAGKIEAFDDRFHFMTSLSAKFVLPNMPKDFAPFGIMALEDRVIVTYAQRRAPDPKQDERFDQQVPGDNKGIVAAFDLNGKLIWSTKSDMFNVPWGLAMGDLRLCATGALLVGQHGDEEKFDGPGNRFGGAIIAMDSRTGKVIGALQDGGKQPVRVQGLWGLTFGTEISDVDQELLHLGAGAVTRDDHDKGQDRVQHGLFARLDPREP